MSDGDLAIQAEALVRCISPKSSNSELFASAYALMLERQYERALYMLEGFCRNDRTSSAGSFLISVAFFATSRFDLARRHADTAELLDLKFGGGVLAPVFERYKPMIELHEASSNAQARDMLLHPEIEEALTLRRYCMPYVTWLMEPHARLKTIDTDGYGFRHTIGPADEVFTVSDFAGSEYYAFFGASAAFGCGCTANDKTIPSRLSAQAGGRAWLNFAIPTSVVEFNLMSAMFLRPMRARPRAFVLFAGCNELSSALLSSVALPPFGVAPNVINMLYAMNGNPDDWIPRVGRPLADHTPFHERDLEKICADLEALLTKTLRNFSYLAKGCGAPLHYVLQPNAHWMSKRRPHPDEIAWFAKLQAHPHNGYAKIADLFEELFPWYRAMVERACAASGIAFFDMNAEPDVAEHDGKLLFCDRVHLTDEGYDLASRFIFEKVLA